jgi:hypothetical protein
VKPLLVGEDNPGADDPSWALWPAPANCAGWRMCYKVLGLTDRQYLARFDRTNLCLNAWSLDEAREAAQKLAAEPRHIILLGAKVCQAFGVPYQPFSRQPTLPGFPGLDLYVLPHPSGRARAWSDPDSFERARQLLAKFLK